MDLAQYVRVLRAHWLLIVGCVATCVALASVVAWTKTPVYASHTQFFVSATTPNPSDIYAGGLFSQQRIQSYAQLVSSPTVLREVIRQLKLRENVTDLGGKITASVPTDTVLINVTVEDESPQRAAAIATALGTRFSRFVTRLEASRGGGSSPLRVTITSAPQVSNSPVSPKKSAYLLLGAMGGLLIGIVAAVIRDVVTAPRASRDIVPTPTAAAQYVPPRELLPPARHVESARSWTPTMPRRLTGPEDVAAIVDAPLLGTVSESNGDLTSLASSSSKAETYRLLQANLRLVALDHGLRSLVVTSAVEGEGKTVIAASLGLALAETGYHVILVDANLRQPTLSAMLGLSRAPGLTDVITAQASVDSVLQPWRRDSAVDGRLQILASGKPTRDAGISLNSNGLTTTLAKLREQADVVIVDSPALLPTHEAVFLRGDSSGAILVARPGSTSVQQLEFAIRSLRAAATPIVGVVLNQPPTGHRA